MPPSSYKRRLRSIVSYSIVYLHVYYHPSKFISLVAKHPVHVYMYIFETYTYTYVFVFPCLFHLMYYIVIRVLLIENQNYILHESKGNFHFSKISVQLFQLSTKICKFQGKLLAKIENSQNTFKIQFKHQSEQFLKEKKSEVIVLKNERLGA